RIYSDIQELQKNWGWLLALGIISIILGLLALGSSAFFTVVSMIFFGWILLIMGILEMIYSFWQRPHLDADAGHVLHGGRLVPDHHRSIHALSQLGMATLRRRHYPAAGHFA